MFCYFSIVDFTEKNNLNHLIYLSFFSDDIDSSKTRIENETCFSPQKFKVKKNCSFSIEIYFRLFVGKLLQQIHVVYSLSLY